MIYLVYTIHVLICFFLVAVVLLQQGKGADLSVFGGGGTQTAFGARGAATLLHKLTVASFIGFIVTTLAIGVMQGEGGESGVIGGLDEAPVAESVEGEATGDEDQAADDAAGAIEATPADEGTGDGAPSGDAAPATDAAAEGDADGTTEGDAAEGGAGN